MKYRKKTDNCCGILFDHPFESNIEQNNDSDELIILPSFIQPTWAEWKTVIIVCTDNWAIIGLRHLLARCGGIRLRVLKELTDPLLWGKPDAVIWMRERFDSLPELAGDVLRLWRTCPLVRQLVISDFLPPGLTRLHKSPLNGVILARGKDGVGILREKVAQLVSGEMPPRLLLRDDVLSPGQWRVLFHMAAGTGTREIAAMNGTTIKNILAYRMKATLRLGLKNRLELAFVLRCIQQMQMVIPAISRTIRHVKKEIRA